MAQLALGLAGAAAGFAIGGPAGAQWGFAIGTAAGGVLFPPKLPDGPRLNDRQVMSSAYGETIPRIYGAYTVAGNIIWSTDLKEQANEAGGKGGGGEQTYYTYSVSCAVSLCQGPIIGIRRIWADGKLFYDGRMTVDELIDNPTLVFQAFLRLSSGEGDNFILYTGTDIQDPDPTIVAEEGAAPAYRGEAYIVFNDLQLARFGNRIPQFKFEVIATDGTIVDARGVVYDTVFSESGATRNISSRMHTEDPETNRIWCIPWFQDDDGIVYDVRNKSYMKRLVMNIDPIPRSSGPPSLPSVGIVDILYIPAKQGSGLLGPWSTPREMWVVYDTYWANGIPPDTYYIDVYDPDTLELKTQLSQVVGGSGQKYIYKMVYNEPKHEVILSTQGASANVFRVWSCISKTLVASPAKPVGSVWQAFLFGNVFYSATLQGTQLYLWDSTTYAYIRQYNLRNEVALPFVNTNEAYFGTTEELNYCIDTRRNRLITIQKCPNTTNPNIHNYLNFDVDGNIIERGTIQLLSGIACIDATWYQEWTDEVWIQNGSSFGAVVIDARTMTVKRQISQTDWNVHSVSIKAVNGYPGNYTGVTTTGLSDGVRIRYYFTNPTTEREKIPLRDIVETECSLVLDLAKVDTTNLEGFCRGVMFSGQGTIRSGLEALMNAYQFDCVESNGKLKFVSRTKAGRTTIPIEDLGSHDFGSDVPTLLPFTRADEIAQPKSLTIRYADYENEYQQGAQQAQRFTTKAENEIIVEVPVTMRPGEAKQLATTALYSAWVARTNTKFTTSWKYAAIEPSDVVTIDGNEIRINKKLLTGNRIEFEGALDNGTIYAQKPVSGQSLVPTQQVLVNINSNIQLLDIRALRDSDSDAGFYIAAEGYEPGWNGAVAFKSIDNGASYYEYLVLTQATVIGGVIATLPAGIENTVDEANALRVRLTNPGSSLSSVTYEAMLNGANACLVGNEILQFRDATLEADESYTLRGLLRGRRGSLPDAVVVGARFVMLSTSTIRRAPMETAELNQVRQYKFPNIGTLLSNAAGVSFVNTGQCLKPVAPVHLGGGRNATGSLTINWIRSSRIGMEWRDFIDNPLAETTESYEIDVLNNASPPAVVRTITATTNTATYTTAQQETDFGSPRPTSITIRVYQMSSTFGRGDYAEAII